MNLSIMRRTTNENGYVRPSVRLIRPHSCMHRWIDRSIRRFAIRTFLLKIIEGNSYPRMFSLCEIAVAEVNPYSSRRSVHVHRCTLGNPR